MKFLFEYFVLSISATPDVTLTNINLFEDTKRTSKVTQSLENWFWRTSYSKTDGSGSNSPAIPTCFYSDSYSDSDNNLLTENYPLQFERGDLIHITLRARNSRDHPVFVIKYERENFCKEFIVFDNDFPGQAKNQLDNSEKNLQDKF